MENQSTSHTTAKKAEQVDEKDSTRPFDENLTKAQSITQCHQRWLQGRQRSTIPTVLPQGVCQTVFYINKDGAYRHFTPGRPPKKAVKDGPNWGPSSEGAETICNACASEDEEIAIPDALN